jgi:hypothetical protein
MIVLTSLSFMRTVEGSLNDKKKSYWNVSISNQSNESYAAKVILTFSEMSLFSLKFSSFFIFYHDREYSKAYHFLQ